MNTMKSISLMIAAAGGLSVTLPAMANGSASGSWGHHGMMWGGGSGWFLGPIMMLLFLVLAVVVVMLVVRWLGGTEGGKTGSSRQTGSSALQILEERFARGEIDEDEFRKRKRALEE